MAQETSLIDGARLAQLLFAAVFSVSVSMILRIANDWRPFTPTFSATRQRAIWRDLLRWAVSGLLLYVLPFLYLAGALVVIAKSGITVPDHWPTMGEFMQIIALIILPIPLLGFYDFWQLIIRTFSFLLYPRSAIESIVTPREDSSTSSRLQTFLLGLLWILLPLVFLLLVSPRQIW